MQTESDTTTKQPSAQKNGSPAVKLIDKPGVYDIAEEIYHADPVIEPSLSASIAKVLLNRTPRHAWARHPRLNPRFKPVNRTLFDLGKAAHTLVLREERAFVVIDAPDWRTKAAKEQRAEAYAAGKTPILVENWAETRAMAAAAHAQLECHEDAAMAFKDGEPDKTLVWQEDGIWCRCRLDWLPNDLEPNAMFFDYKSTGTSANPDYYQRQLYEMGYDIQAAMYRRGLKAVLGVRDPQFNFVVQETEDPFALSVIGLPPSSLDFADKKLDEALKWWGWCLKNDRWPGYPARTCYIEPPVYHEQRWLDREARDGLVREAGGDEYLFKTMMDWQAPLSPLNKETAK